MKKTIAIGIFLSLFLVSNLLTTGTNIRKKEDFPSVLPLTEGKSFYGYCNNSSIYIVTITSSQEIHLNFSYTDYFFILNKTTSGALFNCCYITNGTFFNLVKTFFVSESYTPGKLRYFQIKTGNDEFLFQNRTFRLRDGKIVSGYFRYDNITLPSGKWHFIFTDGLFDHPQNATRTNTSVWMNFTNPPQDLEIITTTGGNIYAYWYGEFDSKLLISKAKVFEMMHNGKVTFKINNTFIYDIGLGPVCQGFWKIRWDTPGGIKKSATLLLRNRQICNYTKQLDCLRGVGPNGTYTLTTSYLDYLPVLFRKRLPQPYASEIYVLGLDVKLP